jgi:hypothetical protein
MFNPFMVQCKRCDEWIDIRDYFDHIEVCKGVKAG